MTRRLLVGLFLCLAALLLGGCAFDQIAAQQEKATGLWDELVAGESFGQTFVATRANLTRVDLGTATFARANSAPVVWHLRTGPNAPTDIVSGTLPGPEIQNDRPTSFVFTPLPDSAGRLYYFWIESPAAGPGNAVTVYANAQDLYPEGAAYKNGQALDGDLAFTAYSRQSFTLAGVLQDFLARAGRDIVFIVLYLALLVAVAAAWLWARRPSRRDS